MSNTIHVRASSLPLASRCAASLVKPEFEITQQSPEIDTGNAVHWLLARYISEEPAGPDWLDAWLDRAITRHPLADPDEAQALFLRGLDCWKGPNGIARWFPDAMTEVEVGNPPVPFSEAHPVALTGHIDVLSVTEESVRIADWKSGREDADATEQLKAYSLAAMLHIKHHTARACRVGLREKTADWFVWGREDLLEWWHVRAQQLQAQSLYFPGRHCGYCKRALECEARGRWVASSATALECLKPGDPVLDWQAVYERVRAVEAVCQSVREILRAETEARGGTLPLNDDYALVLADVQKRTVLPDKGMGALQRAMGYDAYWSALRLSKKDMGAAVRLNNPRGKGAAAIRELWQALEQLGAVETETTQRLEMKRVNSTDHNDSLTVQPDQRSALSLGAQQVTDSDGPAEAPDA